jgi:hypothetical protein
MKLILLQKATRIGFSVSRHSDFRSSAVSFSINFSSAKSLLQKSISLAGSVASRLFMSLGSA